MYPSWTRNCETRLSAHIRCRDGDEFTHNGVRSCTGNTKRRGEKGAAQSRNAHQSHDRKNGRKCARLNRTPRQAVENSVRSPEPRARALEHCEEYDRNARVNSDLQTQPDGKWLLESYGFWETLIKSADVSRRGRWRTKVTHIFIMESLLPQ